MKPHLLLLTLLAFAFPSSAQTNSSVLDVRKIWDAGAHNAFTDLIHWRGAWWCTFRESEGHVGGDGKIRVITSKTGDKWESAALVEEKDIDLRDPKMSITPDNRLMIVCGGSVYLGTKDLKGRQPRVLFSKDGKDWTAPEKVLAEGDWLWRVTWYNKKAYGVSYHTITPDNSGAAKPGKPSPEWRLQMHSSTDGLKWELVSNMEVSGRPNETTLRFLPNGDAMAMVRREAGNGKGWVGVAHPPYTQWTWHENTHKFGGPNFIRLPDGSLIGGTRDYSKPGKVSTLIARMTPDKLDPIANLPSSGDNSYPGLVWQDGTLWVSYYSSHEGKTSIYLARLKVPVLPAPQRVVAIDNVCAWPNLMTLRDGSLMATIFNQPAHGAAEGDVECWVSPDGKLWTKRATITQHDPGANRMNLSAGPAKNGDLVVVTSGWSLKKDAQGKFTVLDQILAPWVCRSTDDGRTWQTAKQNAFPAPAGGFTHYIPFGDILPGGDGALRMAAYGREEKSKIDSVWFFRSEDDGRTWKLQSRINEGNNETAIFHLGAGKWLAAARTIPAAGQRLDLFRSNDDGQTWSAPEPLTAASQHPAHLQRLQDGRLLLTYGNRLVGKFGVQVKLSSDEGKTWGEPITLVDDAINGDSGYPSSVQLKSGEIVSAYYARGVAAHHRYHMGAVTWTPPAK
jgi:hypothetical protein